MAVRVWYNFLLHLSDNDAAGLLSFLSLSLIILCHDLLGQYQDALGSIVATFIMNNLA